MKITFFLIFLALVGACGKKSSNNKKTKFKGIDSSKVTGGHGKKATYEASCQRVKMGDEFQYVTSSLELIELNNIPSFGISVNVAQDQTCATTIVRTETLGVYTFEEQNTRLLLEFEGDVVIPMTSKLAEDFNANFYCGRKDWKKDMARSILGTECSGNNASTIFVNSHDSQDKTVDMYFCDEEVFSKDCTKVVYKKTN